MELSIIIPFYNGEAYISNLLLSINGSLSRCDAKYKVEVLILIDSMNTVEDDLRLILPDVSNNALHIRIFKNAGNKGVAATRNAGIKLATAPHLLFIDQDDMISEDCFSVIKRRDLLDFDFILMNGTMQYSSGVKTKIYYFRPTVTFKSLVLDDFVRSPGQVVVRKQIIEHVGFPEPTDYYGADDKFCWISILHANPDVRIKYIARELYIARIHDQNYSHDQNNLIKSTRNLWDVTLRKFPELENNAYVRRNIRLADFRLGSLRGMEGIKGFLEFLQYKLKANKILRVVVRNFSKQIMKK